jgi:hypothetical protein
MAHHAMVTGDPDKLIGQMEEHCPLVLLGGSDDTPLTRRAHMVEAVWYRPG